MTQSAIVAGAGIAGLAAALALSQHGWSVEIWEKASELGEVGAGLQASPNAMHVLRALGVEEEVLAAGFEPAAALLCGHSTGRRHLDLPLKLICPERYGAPYVHIHRADLHAVLTSAARAAGIVIRLNSPVTAYGRSVSGVEIATDGSTKTADLLVGADGIRSTIREHMLGAENARFTGQVAWRGVVPADRLPRGLVDPSACVWAGPGRHLVTYFLRNGTLLNVVAVEERSDWRDEAWTTPGDPNALRAAFSDWHPTVQKVLAEIEETHLWALFDRPPLAKWCAKRTVLIGDAAHPMLPFMAQGAAMALEDAWILARLVSGATDLQAALGQFERSRKPRTSRVQARARANAGFFHLSEGPFGLRSRAKLAVARYLPRQIALRQFDWIYGFNATLA